MMTPEQIFLVQQSWEKVLPISQTAGELFYDRLTELVPQLENLIDSDHVEQIKKLMTSFNLVINSLNDPDMLKPVLELLGQRHVGYGVIETDYSAASDAFCWALKHSLGKDFTDEVQAAWLEVFHFLSDNMDTSKHSYIN